MGTPARSDAMRATFIPCSASGMAQPMITSSTSSMSRFGHALQRTPDGHRRQIVRPRRAQRPFGPSHAVRRADYHCFSHDSPWT